MKSEGQRPQRWQQNLCLVCQTRSARLKFVTRYISVNLDRGWDDYLFLDECLKYVFFQLPKLKKCCSGESGGGGGGSGEVAPAYQVINRLKIESSVALHAVSHSMPQRLQNVIKKTKMNAGY